MTTEMIKIKESQMNLIMALDAMPMRRADLSLDAVMATLTEGMDLVRIGTTTGPDLLALQSYVSDAMSVLEDQDGKGY